MQQTNRHTLFFNKFWVTMLAFLLAAVVAAAVWQSFVSYSVSSHEYYEAEVRRKLLADLKYIQRSTSRSLHLGNYLAGRAMSFTSADISAGGAGSNLFSDKVLQPHGSARNPRGNFKDRFEWAFFPSNLRADGPMEFSGKELLSPSGTPSPNPATWEVVRLLATKGLAILLDFKLSEEFRHACDQELHGMLDNKTESEQSNFICTAVRNFQPCFINGIQYKLMWFPVFKDRVRETPDWLKNSVEVSGESSLACLAAFQGIVAVLYDEENFKLAAGSRFEHALVENFAQTGCRLDIAKTGPALDEPGNFPVNTNEISRIGGWLQTRIVVPDLDNRLVFLARKIPAEVSSVKLMRSLIFLALLAWMSAIVYFIGNHVIMGRKVASGLRTQLAAIVAIFLLPAFLQAMISMERYLDSSRNSALQRIRHESEEALDALDKSVKLLRTRLCSYVDDRIFQAGQAEDFCLIQGSEEEQKLWLVGFLRSFLEVGIVMKNALLVNSTGKIVTKFIGSNRSEEKFFQQLGASIFLPTLNALNPQSARNDDKKILLQAQAEEMLEIMGNVFPPEIFPAMAHTFSRLTRLEGFGDQAFLYHRFLGQKARIDAAFMVAFYSPSLECLAFNSWFSNFPGEDLKPIWLIKKKTTPEWFLRAPFGRVPASEKASTLKFVYGLLPNEIAYRVQVDSMTRETQVSEFYWNGQSWYFATQPGQDLIDYQLSALIPLSEHHRRFALFKSELRSAMLLIFMFCGVIGWRLASGFVKPVRCFAETAERLMEGDFTARMNEKWADEEFSQIAGKFNVIAEDIENGRLLRKFVSDGALQTIVESEKLDLKKSMLTRRALIMFVKLDGFWGSMAGKSPAKALSELNHFFSGVCSSVKKAGGEVSKFIAEKAMTTFFIAETDSPGTRATLALEAAIAVIERLQRHKLIDESCRVRVGIAYGHVRDGIIGVEAVRLEQTVIGDAVNLAARLCTHSGDFGILVCGATYEILKGSGLSSLQLAAFKQLPPQEIKGKKQVVEVYSVDIAGYMS